MATKAEKQDIARAKAAANKTTASKAKMAKYNTAAAQAQRGKESLTRNSKALNTKTAAQMTPKQRAAAIAKEQAKAKKARAAFAKAQGVKGKIKAQGAKALSAPTDRYGKRKKDGWS